MWVCPKCKRQFRNTNQNHTCQMVAVSEIFRNRPPHLKSIFDKIVAVIDTFGEYRIEPIPYDVIRFKTKSTFVSIKRKKGHLALSFYLDHLQDVPPVSKYLQTSKKRVVHVVPVDALEDIDSQLIEWMRYSFELIKK